MYNQRGLLLTSPGIPTDASRRRPVTRDHTHTTAVCCSPYPPLPRTPTAGPGVFTLRMVLPPTLPHPSTPSSHPLSQHIPTPTKGLVLLHSCSAHLSTIVYRSSSRERAWFTSMVLRSSSLSSQQYAAVVLVLRNTRPLSYEVSVERTSDKKLSCLHVPKKHSLPHLKHRKNLSLGSSVG